MLRRLIIRNQCRIDRSHLGADLYHLTFVVCSDISLLTSIKRTFADTSGTSTVIIRNTSSESSLTELAHVFLMCVVLSSQVSGRRFD